MNKKFGFTLAEVLITLAIVGVVAALTIPTLIEKHNKQVVETRLKKFYSSMNQAVNMAKVEYGDVNTWWEDIAQLDEQREFFMSHVGKHLSIVKIETMLIGGRQGSVYYLSDGSAFTIRAVSINGGGGRDWFYIPNKPSKCLVSANTLKDMTGRCAFAFMFTNDKGFRTYDSGWDGNIASLYSHATYGCGYVGSNNAYCTRLIHANSWKIPDDYPFKVR